MASSVIIQLHIGAAGEESHVATLSGAARSAMATSDDNKEARRPQTAEDLSLCWIRSSSPQAPSLSPICTAPTGT